MKDERLLDAQDQAEHLGGVLDLALRTTSLVEIVRMKLPAWEGEREEFFDILITLSDRSELLMVIDPERAISAGERKIACAALEEAGFVEDVMVSDPKITAGELVRLPTPCYTPDPAFI